MEEKVLTTYVRGIYCRQCPEWIVDDLLHLSLIHISEPTRH